jgi:hypothetical protein
MIPRARRVPYQGTPAYGYRPCGFRVRSIRRSDTERSSHSSKSPLDEATRAPLAAAPPVPRPGGRPHRHRTAPARWTPGCSSHRTSSRLPPASASERTSLSVTWVGTGRHRRRPSKDAVQTLVGDADAVGVQLRRCASSPARGVPTSNTSAKSASNRRAARRPPRRRKLWTDSLVTRRPRGYTPEQVHAAVRHRQPPPRDRSGLVRSTARARCPDQVELSVIGR